MKDKDNRMFVFLNNNKKDQEEFIKTCQENGCFAQAIPFMVRQKPFEMFKNNALTEDKQSWYWNGLRPYLTLSNADPDCVGGYTNWTYLDSIVEWGWRSQFPT